MKFTFIILSAVFFSLSFDSLHASHSEFKDENGTTWRISGNFNEEIHRLPSNTTLLRKCTLIPHGTNDNSEVEEIFIGEYDSHNGTNIHVFIYLQESSRYTDFFNNKLVETQFGKQRNNIKGAFKSSEGCLFEFLDLFKSEGVIPQVLIEKIADIIHTQEGR